MLACTFGGALAGMKLRAVFLVLEMDSPFQGLIRVTGEPLRFAVQRLDQ